ncbi:hypothetical protein KTN00_07025 [Acinetobacter soli]|uniref:hypothetical protein n=1 Tax=Acinetobacter soli TaxID=487316 RepID=UPI001C46FC78|nr:hypothetical protein [Acinetobacter soli]MBV6550775.1 hypothetical protein [Acinetobacter soli]
MNISLFKLLKSYKLKAGDILALSFLFLWLIVPVWLILTNKSSTFLLTLNFLLCLIVSGILFHEKFNIPSQKNIGIIFIIFSCIFLSFIFNIDKINIFLNIILYLILALFLVQMAEKKYEYFLLTLKFYSLVNVSNLLYIYIKYGNSFEGRSIIEGVSANPLGLICISGALGCLLFNKRTVRILLLSVYLLLTISVSARSAILCISILYAYEFFYVLKRNTLCFLLGLVGISGLIFWKYNFFYSILSEIFLFDDSYRGLDSGGSGRIEIWSRIPEYLNGMSVFFGVGFKEGKEVLGSTIDSAYASIILELGFLGGGTLIFLMLLLLIKSLKNILLVNNKNIIFCSLVIVTYSIYGVFESRYINFGNPYTFIYFFSIFYLFRKKTKGN